MAFCHKCQIDIYSSRVLRTCIQRICVTIAPANCTRGFVALPACDIRGKMSHYTLRIKRQELCKLRARAPQGTRRETRNYGRGSKTRNHSVGPFCLYDVGQSRRRINSHRPKRDLPGLVPCRTAEDAVMGPHQPGATESSNVAAISR